MIDRVAEHAAVADRFAHEIVRFLSGRAERSRRLSGSPFGGSSSALLQYPAAYRHLSGESQARRMAKHTN